MTFLKQGCSKLFWDF